MFTPKTKLVITCFYIVHCMLCLITNQKIKRKTYILNFVLVYCDKLRAYSDVRVFSAAEILLRIYKNPIHLNGKRWPTVGELHAASKTSSANGSHLNVCDFAVSAAEFPQQKKRASLVWIDPYTIIPHLWHPWIPMKWTFKDKLGHTELLIYRSIYSGPLEFDISKFYYI